MLNKIPLACLAGFIVTSPLSLPAAEQPTVSIQILATFDYPGDSISTIPAEINDNGDIAGSYIDSNGLQRGFVRYRNGSFSPPIIPPFDTGSFTAADDIDDSRVICGFFSSPDDTVFHGYFVSGNTFRQFDVDCALSTFVNALNNAGNFAGSFDSDPEMTQAFVEIEGDFESFGIPDASFTGATSINRLNETIGNYRIGTETTNHGFLRDAFGNLTFPIDFPGALGPSGTVLRGINDRGWVAGGYFDRNSWNTAFSSGERSVSSPSIIPTRSTRG